MAQGTGRQNNFIFAENADFSGNNPPDITNGIQTNGHFWIGSTASNAGGTNINVGRITSPFGTINVGYASPNITLDVTGAGFQWIDQGTSTTAVKETGYFVTAAITMTLPTTPAQGDTIQFSLQTASQLTIQASAGQTIRLGNTVGAAAGTAKSNAIGDTIELVYRSANTQWVGVDSTGNWTIA